MSALQGLSKSKAKGQTRVQRSTSGNTASSVHASSPVSAFYAAGPALTLGAPTQAKLAIGQANDPYEREADTVAERVANSQPVSSISSISPGGLGNVAQPQSEEESRKEQQLPQSLLLQRQVAEAMRDQETEEEQLQPLLVQRQGVEENEETPEELMQPFLLQRQSVNGSEEEKTPEESVQALLLQRQAADEEEEAPETLTQPLFLQRQPASEDEIPEGSPEEEQLREPLPLQQQPAEAMKEEGSEEELLQPQLIQRQPASEVKETKEEHPAPQDETNLVQSCGCSGACTCGAKKEERRIEEMNRPSQAIVQTSTSDSADAAGPGPDAVSRAIHHRGSGESLNPEVQNTIESQTGLDMSTVRVHRDSTAQSAARALKARAFTHGSDIWLGPGESPDNLRLMAHEATHVIQQSSSTGGIQTIQRKPADYQHPEDGGAVSGRLNRRFEREISEEDRRAAREGGADQGSTGATAEGRRSSSTIDRRELRQRSDEIKGDTRPDVDRPAQEQPGVNQSAAVVEREAESPPEPIVEGEQQAPPKEEEKVGKGAMGAAEQAAGLARQAFAAAQAQPEPAPEIEVQPPEPVMPVDSTGEPLEPDPEADMIVASLAGRAQFLREQGTFLRTQASEGRGNAQIIRGNLAKVTGEVSKAEQGISKSQDHAQYRREVVGQAEQALGVSEEKASTVAAQAPDYQSKADEGKEDTGPMSGEAGALASENAANTPDDDPEAAANSRKQGQKINQVGSDAMTMDSAVSQTRSRADSLAQDAARAKEMNTQSKGKITASQGQLDQLDARLSQHSEQASQARGQVESMAGQPGDLNARSDQLDEQGQALIASSFELEERLHGVQRSYAEGMRSVPPLEPWEGETPAEEGAIQMQPTGEREQTVPGGATPAGAPTTAAAMPTAPAAAAPTVTPAAMVPGTPSATSAAVPDSVRATGVEPGAAEEERTAADEPESEAEEPATARGAEPGAEGEGEAPAEEAETGGAAEAMPEVENLAPRAREPIDINRELPPWLTGIDPQSVEQREAAEQEQEDQRRAEISQINEWAGGRPIAQLGGGERLGIALRLVGQRYYNSIANIKWPGWGGLAKALLDPRSMLTGTIGGLNMILNAGANLFSAERWRKDPLGNLLKSAADIATGLAIVLGSITALAAVVAAIMGALLLITFGFAAPIALPVISVCTTIITTVGGWTIAVGKVALVLQALSLIKNLIDAATAQTAEDVQREAGEIQSDINGGFAAAMSIVGAKGAQAGIRQVRSRAAGVLRASRRAGGARALARATVRAAPGRLRAAGTRALRRARRRAVTLPRRLARRGRRAVEAIGSLPGRAREGVTALRDRLRNRFGRRRGDVLAEHPATGGHKIRVRGGQIDLCTDCTNISLVYREALGSKPALNRDWQRIRDMAEKADRTGNARLAAKAARDMAKLERTLASEGVIRGGVRYFPEEPLLKGGKHGLDWTEGPARLQDELARGRYKPQGQFGTPRDIQYAVERGADLGPGQSRHFALPPDHRSFVWVLRDGKIQRVPATGVFVKVYPNGKIHAFPVEVQTSFPF